MDATPINAAKKKMGFRYFNNTERVQDMKNNIHGKIHPNNKIGLDHLPKKLPAPSFAIIVKGEIRSHKGDKSMDKVPPKPATKAQNGPCLAAIL